MTALVDVRPLRESAAFRRLWLGSTASGLGTRMNHFAVLYLVWERTGDPAAVGLIGLASGLPLLVLALAGGAFQDQVDRRSLALRCTWFQIASGAVLVAVAFTGAGGVAAVLALVAANSAAAGLGAPARRAIVPALIGEERLAAGLALGQLSFQLTLLTAPALAGALTAVAGVGWCFVVDLVSFLAALHGLAGVPRGISGGAGRPGPRALARGLALAASTPLIRGALLTDLAATVLAMPIAVLPVLNSERFGGRPEVLGLLTTALAVGGVSASAWSGLVTARSRPGLVSVLCALGWSLSLALVGVVPDLAAALVLLAAAGAADTWSVTCRAAVIQSATPDSHRGRVSSLEYVVGVAGPELGNLRAGLVASTTSGGASLALGGGAATLAIGVVALATPALRHGRRENSGGTGTRPVQASS